MTTYRAPEDMTSLQQLAYQGIRHAAGLDHEQSVVEVLRATRAHNEQVEQTLHPVGTMQYIVVDSSIAVGRFDDAAEATTAFLLRQRRYVPTEQHRVSLIKGEKIR